MRNFLLCLLLAGCTTFTTPVVPEYQKDEVTIHWIRTDDVKRICKQPNSLACAFVDTEPCTIVTYKEPAWETVGHEVGHCFFGRWHD